MSELDKALEYCKSHQDEFLDRLSELVKIPGISAWDESKGALVKSAEAIEQELQAAGLEHTELLTFGDVPPYVYGERIESPDLPTLLLYAHHDVQPPGEHERWLSDPFEPTKREGPNGLRLYGRGAADDKAGAMCHVAAIESWLKTAGRLPVNVKVIIEGEEEIGSTHLSQCLTKYQDKLNSDIIILTDTANYDTGIPSLTYSLRGMVSLDLEVRTVDHAVHSGMWGGPIVDPLLVLSQLLGTVYDESGKIAIDGFYDGIREPEAWESQRLEELGYTEAKFREESGLLATTSLTGEADKSLLERLWLRPTFTVTALDACPLAKSANKILPYAKARISCRIVPNQDPQQVLACIAEHFRKHIRYGAELKITNTDGVPGWVCVPQGPAFDAAERALEAGFGRKTAFIGCGGTIPFVGPFAEAFGGAPSILVGLEDPYTNAHGENESLHIEDFNKLMNSSVRMLAEMANVPVK